MNSQSHVGFARRLACAGTLFLMLQQCQAAAMQSDSEQVAQVTLADVKALPGASVMVPLSLTPDPKNPMRALTLDIDFVSNNLTFAKTSRGLAAEIANADIQASLTESPVDDKGLKRAKVRVLVSLQDSKSKEGLPDGLLAYLVFQVGKDARPFTIKLTPTVVSAESLATPPKKILAISTEPGSVTIENPDASLESISPELNPEVGCFFFTH
jgi:hypothetical protein